jgi:hypothetical protein
MISTKPLEYEIRPWLDAGLGMSLLNIEPPAVNDEYLQGRPKLCQRCDDEPHDPGS